MWVESSKEDFDLLIKVVANGFNNNNYKTITNNHRYDLKNAEKFLLEATTKKLVKMRQINCLMI